MRKPRDALFSNMEQEILIKHLNFGDNAFEKRKLPTNYDQLGQIKFFFDFEEPMKETNLLLSITTSDVHDA